MNIGEEISEIRRIEDKSRNAVRLILVQSKNWNKRMEIFQAAKKLKERNEDYTIYRRIVRN